MSKGQIRRERKRKRFKQRKLNQKLKKKLFGHLIISPCCYCKRVFLVAELTVEHIVPLCCGGNSDPANIALACSPCNHQRGKEAWHTLHQANKKYYEQHYPRNRIQNQSSPV